MVLKKISSVILLFIFGFYSETVKSQYCGCSPILCCSKFGYCGSTDDYCGSGCKSGPCRKTREPLDRIVTQKFFDGIISQAGSGCSGKRFYTRDSFLKAANTNLVFNMSVTRLEIATMFAHFTYATQHFCYIEEVNGSSHDYCNETNRQYPCAPGKNYYGRGPIQLSWNYNYGLCGQSLRLDLLGHPELVVSNPTVAFRTSLWFWMKSVRPVMNQGFGATIKAINSLAWNGGNASAVTSRVEYYKNYCKKLSVDPGGPVVPSKAQGSPKDYVNAHNQARSKVGVGPMQWDEGLAAYAGNYVDHLKSDCRVVHSGGPYGENLAMSSGNLSAVTAVNLWVNEKANYNYNSNSCNGVCGHYTQVVWRNSVRLGCAKVWCNNGGGTIISCNYDPPGNYMYKRPY
ncbi:unnamed protein product [Arabidopsis halleri]